LPADAHTIKVGIAATRLATTFLCPGSGKILSIREENETAAMITATIVGDDTINASTKGPETLWAKNHHIIRRNRRRRSEILSLVPLMNDAGVDGDWRISADTPIFEITKNLQWVQGEHINLSA